MPDARMRVVTLAASPLTSTGRQAMRTMHASILTAAGDFQDHVLVPRRGRCCCRRCSLRLGSAIPTCLIQASGRTTCDRRRPTVSGQ
jgi:hypothetical protein